MSILNATIAHAPVLAAMHAQAFPEDPWSEAAFISLLAQPGMTALIDERGGFLLLRTILDEAEIITIGVTHPRQGIATRLLQTALACTIATKIHLEAAESNTAALALYTRLGFTPSGRRPAYYPNGTAALTMTLTISPKHRPTTN
jgi:ribosomal-protein-alanine N-acetyltransferase